MSEEHGADPKRSADETPRPAEETAGRDLFDALVSGERAALGRAITLVESRRPSDLDAKRELIEKCARRGYPSLRIGVSGPPGAGKSTFIERFGLNLIADGHRVAVLAVDPSSERTGGSILGDKTRMERLSSSTDAYIRPSPNAGVLGGVTEMTRETILICEAAGYDVVLVETVGVGQAEFGVHGMVDFFLLITMPGTGDELQGIKRGIVEMADLIVINKADGDNRDAAERAASDLRGTLLLPGTNSESRVVTASSRTGDGLAEIWRLVSERIDSARTSGSFDARRLDQRRNWFENAVAYLLRSHLSSDDRLRRLRSELLERVAHGSAEPLNAASEFVEAVLSSGRA